MRVREERKYENLRMRDGLGASRRLGSVVQGRGKTAGARGLVTWVIAGEKKQKIKTEDTWLTVAECQNFLFFALESFDVEGFFFGILVLK